MSQRLCPPCTKAILKIAAVSRDEPGSPVYELTEERKATPISKAAAKCALCNLVHTYLTQYADNALPDNDERSSYHETWETKPTAKIEYTLFGSTLSRTAGEELYPHDSLFLSMTRDLRSFTFNVWVEEEFANSTSESTTLQSAFLLSSSSMRHPKSPWKATAWYTACGKQQAHRDPRYGWPVAA